MRYPHKRPNPTSQNAGFSLAELMVVIVILGILAGLVIPNVVGALKRALGGAAKADITTITSGVKDYYIQNSGRYPESLEELITPDENGITYISGRKIPKDPWGREYLYDPYPGENRGPRVFTNGKDGQPGGEGEDRDMDNFMIEDGDI
jgi:general secretion pathway protein G